MTLKSENLVIQMHKIQPSENFSFLNVTITQQFKWWLLSSLKMNLLIMKAIPY